MTSLKGLLVLVTSGPTHEPIDPVRFLGNRSSGKQGHAIASALQKAGAKVTLVTGPVALPNPTKITTKNIVTAREMLKACETALPVDIVICAAAVADWRPVKTAAQKMKKTGVPPVIKLTENPDILRTIAQKKTNRPKLVIGFAAETKALLSNAKAKRKRKGCDWILANDVSGLKGFDAEANQVILITESGHETWPIMSKTALAERLVKAIAAHFNR